jgi:RNA polymerase-interacting CarD/CdnL/TRCF family regulator
MEQNIEFSVGEWIVHSQYGVGQIRKTEVMPFHGEQTECFRVKVKDGAFWFPTDTGDNPRIRRVASQEIIPKLIRNLRRKTSRLKKDKKDWNQQIKTVSLDGDLLTMSQLVRDLSAQQTQKRLNDSQIRALTRFSERLVNEWAAITATDVDQIRPQFNQYIQESKAKIPDE